MSSDYHSYCWNGDSLQIDEIAPGIHLKASGIERMKTICELAFPDTLLSVIEERVGGL